MMNKRLVGLLGAVFLLIQGGVASQVLAQSSDNSPVPIQLDDTSLFMNTTKRQPVTTSSVPEMQISQSSTQSQPFGANLFISGFESERSDGLNDSYLIAPGDKIAVQIWGTVNQSEVLTVDNQGNIFISNIGPVYVQGTSAAKLNTLVTSKIKNIYKKNIDVYINLLTSTPVSVFVTGPVLRPGQYAGLASDSLLYFLKRAGGIDPVRGSYRNVSLLRAGKTIQTFDLYKFVREGYLDSVSFQDGDVLLVSEQGAVVTVEGSARYPLKFELDPDKTLGQDLIYYARPLAKVSHVGIVGDRKSGPVAVYIPIENFSTFLLGDGDVVTFNDDLRPEVISISVSGSYVGPSFYTLHRDAKLRELLDHIKVEPDQADFASVYIKRKSVAAQQKKLLEESLQRLERTVFTAPAASNGEAQIRAAEADLVMRFVERARAIEPLGKVVVSSNGNVANVRLEHGDEIVIPRKTDLIQVAGEVLIPQAIVYNAKAAVSDYVAWAGGYSDRANVERIAIIHANGLITFVDGNSNNGKGNDESSINPGDQILILPRVDSKTMQAVKDITQIIYQLAVTANVAFRN
ncbi:MAG: polysaccharide export protein [Paraglaciecola sp.]|nr:polysaccharide export protein [Paraglaciecola sp.]NCT47567.1 polysaccharide export protein [Paraglaciecola sp.]